ncbi:MAG: peptide-methionine (S)-S-oxide reductase MsrA [Candidatus Sericytochromatia bacterium]
MAHETATLGGGCFWCLEAVFQRLRGVQKVVSGYAGGHVVNPSYEQVCRKTTGHAEVVRITYDPADIGFSDLLEVFWGIHDPTTPHRQGNDAGPQYRSIILYESNRQKAEAQVVKQAAQKDFKAKIVTEIVPLKDFYPAEKYHQNYYNAHPSEPYCTLVVAPKVKKFMQMFGEKAKR